MFPDARFETEDIRISARSMSAFYFNLVFTTGVGGVTQTGIYGPTFGVVLCNCHHKQLPLVRQQLVQLQAQR